MREILSQKKKTAKIINIREERRKQLYNRRKTDLRTLALMNATQPYRPVGQKRHIEK